jgi:predicted Zn-dependent protease
VNVEDKFVAMDEELVDLMSGLGSDQERDNALAFLLGHELAHYAASESSGFASDRTTAMLQAVCAGQKEKKQRDACITKLNQSGMADKMDREARADRLGSWYAVEAGYEPFPAAELAIRAIYKRYYPGGGPSG